MELFGLPATLFVQGGAVALLFATIWLIMTGRIVPRSTLEDIKTDRDNWRQAHQTIQETTRIQAEQLDELLELARTTGELVKALPPPTGRYAPRGGRQ